MMQFIAKDTEINHRKTQQTPSVLSENIEIDEDYVLDTSSSNKTTSTSSGSEPVVGPDGQICSSQEVLDQVLKRYKHISANTFRGGANGKIESMFMLCECESDELERCGLDSGCINREMMIECPPDCENCQNQQFQKLQYPQLEIYQTKRKGLGLRTKQDLRKGTFIIEYCGEVLANAIFEKRRVEYSEKGAKHFYFMALKPQEWIDATRRGNISRFMNHSCDPNCALQKWIVGDRVRLGIFATCDIPAETELCFDYKFECYGTKAQICHCGSANCTGYIGKDKASTGTRTLDQLDLISDDEEIEMSGVRSKKKESRISSVEDVKSLAKYLMVNTLDHTKILKGLGKLAKTDTHLQRKFVHFRGLVILYSCLNNHLESKDFVRFNILSALKELPVSTKNAVQKIEELVSKLIDPIYGEDTNRVANEVLDKWKDLELVYKIPKRERSLLSPKKTPIHLENVNYPQTIEGSFTPSDSNQSYILQKIDFGGIPSTAIKTWNTVSKSVSTPEPPVPQQTKASNQESLSLADILNKAQVESEKRNQEAKRKAEKELERNLKEAKAAKKSFKEMKNRHKKLAETVEIPPSKSNSKALIKELSTEERQQIKGDISKIVIKVMSRFRDQIPADLFKDKAKIVSFINKITKALIEKELRTGHSKIDKKTEKAMKKYVVEYLGRHGIETSNEKDDA